MFKDSYQLPPKKVSAIEWTGDPLHYDFQLFGLGKGHREFWAINPNNDILEQWDTDLKFYVDTIPDTRKCVVLSYRGEWIVKIFKQDWYPYHGYENVEIVKPKIIWSYNSDVDKQITFEDNPYGLYVPDPWERNYKLVWYMDPRFNPLDEDVWVFSCHPVNGDILGTKHMGYIIPDIEVSFNDVLPDLGVDVNECCPPYWDLIYECAYELDRTHLSSHDELLWVIKFKPMWGPPKDWKWIGTISPEYTVILNPDLPDLSYDIDYVIPWHDFKFEHVWMIDRKHLHPGEDDIWAFTIQVSSELDGSKIIDYVSPVAEIIYNPDLPHTAYDIDYVIPWHDFKFEHVWMLDRKHLQQGEVDMWAFTIHVSNEPSGSKIIDHVSPETEIIYNPDLPLMSYDIDYVIPWYDFKFEHVWMLDRKHLQHGEKDIWAFTIHVSNEPSGSKIIDHVSPETEIIYNPDLPLMSYDIDYVIPWYDFKFAHVWMLDRSISGQSNIWALRLYVSDELEGIKQLGTVIPSNLSKQLDVIFISYHEVNAEENWQRVLEKAPHAKRVNGVKGILSAHKAAAKLAKSDMFYVVDGDAYLSDDWNFDFQPTIFDRDCTYVWNSLNPVNSLTYGFGGVKLFSKSKIQRLRSWGTDLTLSVSNKLKVINAISNITKFNTSEYATWRTAFRECAKLSKKEDTESKQRLLAWLNPVPTSEYYEWAKLGAEQGQLYASSDLPIDNINDYDWLQLQFKGKLNE